MEFALTMTKIEFVGSFLPENALIYRIQSMYLFRENVQKTNLEEFREQPGYFRFSVADTWNDVCLALRDGGSPEFMAACTQIIQDSMPCTQTELDAVTVDIDQFVEKKLETHRLMLELLQKL